MTSKFMAPAMHLAPIVSGFSTTLWGLIENERMAVKHQAWIPVYRGERYMRQATRLTLNSSLLTTITLTQTDLFSLYFAR
ncbi:hypothetical protein IW262DRAFT_527607 [Armillaria fumosa]|nr:hypothetical protein IW262DRAFT_527607 [Armillaria fumosa]